MKSKLLDEIKTIRDEAMRFFSVAVEYAKFTAAEKFTLLSGMLVIGIVCLFAFAFILIFLGFSCAELFKLFMCPALAYLSTAGIFFVLCLLLVLLRKPLILTPISRLLTRILFDRKPKTDK
ncbi:MAG: hypothetical protein ACI305_00020 [Lepagella sp.]